jgi:hypothetical protein
MRQPWRCRHRWTRSDTEEVELSSLPVDVGNPVHVTRTRMHALWTPPPVLRFSSIYEGGWRQGISLFLILNAFVLVIPIMVTINVAKTGVEGVVLSWLVYFVVVFGIPLASCRRKTSNASERYLKHVAAVRQMANSIVSPHDLTLQGVKVGRVPNVAEVWSTDVRVEIEKDKYELVPMYIRTNYVDVSASK